MSHSPPYFIPVFGYLRPLSGRHNTPGHLFYADDRELFHCIVLLQCPLYRTLMSLNHTILFAVYNGTKHTRSTPPDIRLVYQASAAPRSLHCCVSSSPGASFAMTLSAANSAPAAWHAARKASRARTGTRARRPNIVRRLIQEDGHAAGSVDPDAEAGVERSGGRAGSTRRS